MRSAIQIVVQACLLALSFTLEASRAVSGQTSEVPGAAVVDLKEATVRFVKLFDETCFQHRHALNELRERAASRGWRELPGPFPYHHVDESSTTLIAWGLWLAGVPYQVGLTVFEDTAPAITCTVMSAAMDKASLPDQMLKITDLKIFKKLSVNNQNVTLFDTSEEKQLRIACFTAIEEKVTVGQCALVFAAPSQEGRKIDNGR